MRCQPNLQSHLIQLHNRPHNSSKDNLVVPDVEVELLRPAPAAVLLQGAEVRRLVAVELPRLNRVAGVALLQLSRDGVVERRGEVRQLRVGEAAVQLRLDVAVHQHKGRSAALRLLAEEVLRHRAQDGVLRLRDRRHPRRS